MFLKEKGDGCFGEVLLSLDDRTNNFYFKKNVKESVERERENSGEMRLL